MDQNYTPPDKKERDERTFAMLCHLLAFSGYFIPFGNIFGPLIIWLVKKDEYPLVNDQGKESLNFQISIFIYLICCIPFLLIIIGIPMMIGLGIFSLVVTIIATIKANDGIRYRYPMCISFIH